MDRPGDVFLQYVCLYILLKIGHEYYARSVPSPSEELSSLWRAVKRQCNRMCSCCRRGKKTNRKKHRTKVHTSISDIEEGKIPESTRKTLGSTGSSKGESCGNETHGLQIGRRNSPSANYTATICFPYKQ